MRLALVTTLALLPAAAFAQSSSQTTMVAGLAQPAGLSRAASASSSPATPSVALAPLHLHDVVKTAMVSVQMDESIAQGGSISYTLMGSDSQPEFVPPVLIHTVGRTMPVEEASNSDAKVLLGFTVDVQGRPCDIRVLRSDSAAVDKGTIDAVSQYRFKPATFQNAPAVAHLTMEISLQK